MNKLLVGVTISTAQKANTITSSVKSVTRVTESSAVALVGTVSWGILAIPERVWGVKASTRRCDKRRRVDGGHPNSSFVNLEKVGNEGIEVNIGVSKVIESEFLPVPVLD